MTHRYWGLALALSAASSACASAGPSARAIRMYDHEQPSAALLDAHIREMGDTLALVNEILGDTPYTPGARWVGQLALTAETEAQARVGNSQASFAGLYAGHVRSVLNAAAVPAATKTTSLPQFPSLSDALAQVHPQLSPQGGQLEQQLKDALQAINEHAASLQADPNANPAELEQMRAATAEYNARLARLHSALARPPSAADLADPVHAQIVKDALTATSVAVRMTLEAMSLATVVGLEAAALARRPGKRWAQDAPEAIAVGVDLPSNAKRLYLELRAAKENMERQLKTLAELERVDPLSTAGYLYQDGLVDDVVGLGLDSVHVEVEGAGEALFYSAIASEETSSKGGNTYDYTGRFTKLEYDVEPIVLASAGLNVKFDWAHWAEAMGLKLGYATNRVYKSGGEVTTGSLANELGVDNAWSDALDAALAIAGVTASVRLAHFNHGIVRDILIADGSELAQAPFTFDMKQIDIGYDLAPKRGPLLQKMTVGFRYYDYTLPRVLYELVNSTPDQESAAYVYSRETPPQAVRTEFYMAALNARVEKRVTPHFLPYLTVDFAAGYGPTRYYFLRNDQRADVESNRDYTSSSGIALTAGMSLGMRYRLGGPERRLNAFFDAYYHAQSLLPLQDTRDDGDTIIDVATTDIFHGPVAAFGATF